MSKYKSNKITTLGYFVKRLKDNKFIVFRVFNNYAKSDPRRWTVLLEPGNESIFITCFENKNSPGELLFDIDDGGRIFPINYSMKTDSIEVLIIHLLAKGVVPRAHTLIQSNEQSNHKQ